jgi:hypothetical protein
MKTKLELTKEQVDKLVAAEEKQLRARLEKDLAAIRKKYEFLEIEIQDPVKTDKIKLTDELFIKYWKEGMKVKDIAQLFNYDIGYLYKIKKRLIKGELREINVSNNKQKIS